MNSVIRTSATPTPVLVLGGQENGLAIVRSLTRRGIPVHVAAVTKSLGLADRITSYGTLSPPGSTGETQLNVVIPPGTSCASARSRASPGVPQISGSPSSQSHCPAVTPSMSLSTSGLSIQPSRSTS